MHNIYLNRLKEYCEKENFKGYDPFDGLNSKFFRVLPYLHESRFFRLVWLQIFKRSPINLRPLFGIMKDYNPKGLGLFLSGYCNLYKAEKKEEYLDKITFLIDKINACQSQEYSGACWGYNFDWQARAFFQPKGLPSVVVSSYIACALLDAYEILQDDTLLKTARSTCDFILNDLYRTYDLQGDFAFSYCPVDKTQVFNASLLGCRLLCRVYAFTKESFLLEESGKAIAFACKHQHENGAWTYSSLPFHQWIDNFHTGYNLECIHTFQTISGDNRFANYFEKGLRYYLETFFEKDGIPKYYNHSRYPVEMHNTAQLIITLSKTGKFMEHQELIDRVLNWSQKNMFDMKKGYFYYRKHKYYTIKISYIRWIQAWMFLGYSHYILNTGK
ncbi:MAG: delta-aminolevulinic acid dehydratase [Prevotellaceae bacterium]|jgi:rhamnogalacturonyl hydrolase YesR|nr:delta-aminolevulinic acid dehydratase [Prevotellaceae bacterium]